LNSSFLQQSTLTTDGQVVTMGPHGNKTRATLEMERLDGNPASLAYEVQYVADGPWTVLPGSPNVLGDGNEVYTWSAYNAWAYRFTLTQGVPPTVGIKATLKLWNEGDVDPPLTPSTSSYQADRIAT